MGGVTSGWSMVYMGGEVVAHDQAIEQWKLWSSMKHDELGDMGRLVPMK
jgi:hypothetical protein